MASPEIITEIENIRNHFKANKLLSNSDDEQPLVHLPFANPDEIVSIDDKINATLTVDFTTNKLYNTVKGENITLYHRSYDGKLVAPTLRIKPGDSLLLNLVNQLPIYEPREDCDPYAAMSDDVDPNYIDSLRFNNTNLHTHGLHVSPMAHGDNVFVNLAPECSFQSRIAIPTNHAQGTFWYHPHVHGSTAIQVSSGMGGALIIEGGLDDQPEIKAMEEKIFVLQQMPYVPDTATGGNPDRYAMKFIEGVTFGPDTWEEGIEDSTGWRTTINGMVIPIIEIESNEAQRWRFVHAGVRETINLKLISLDDDQMNLETLYTVAQDGIAYGYRNDVDSMILQPGYRADLLIQPKLGEGLAQDTLYLIDANSAELSGENNESEKILAIIVLKPDSGTPIARTLPSSESLASYAPYPSLINEPVTDEMQYVDFVIRNVADTTRFQINGVSFSHTNPPRTLSLNKVQEWTLTSSLAGHPFHIHINHFQIQELYSKVDGNWVDQNPAPIWKDTYFVNSTDSVIIKTIYKDFIGDFVLHCHILDHEDQGMMECVRIDSANTISKYLLDQGIKFCGPEYSNTLSNELNSNLSD